MNHDDQSIENSVDDIEQSIQKTKEDLAEKLDSLRSEVETSYEHAEESVREVVDDVKRVFNFRYQVEKHPLIFFGSSLAAGYVIGSKVFSGRRTERNKHLTKYVEGTIKPAESNLSPRFNERLEPAPAAPAAAAAAAPVSPSVFGGVVGKVGHEVKNYKGASIRVLLGTLRELAKQSVPRPLSRTIDGIFDVSAQRLGGDTSGRFGGVRSFGP